jgi:hypothetical protein
MFHKFKITTSAFILCLFGLTLMTVSPVFAADSAAFKQCQKIKPQGKFRPMKQKKNCFKNLAGPRSSAEFGECRKIKPQRKFIPMKQKKNCFRDLARSLQSGAKADTQVADQAADQAADQFKTLALDLEAQRLETKRIRAEEVSKNTFRHKTEMVSKTSVIVAETHNLAYEVHNLAFQCGLPYDGYYGKPKAEGGTQPIPARPPRLRLPIGR